MKLKDPLKMFLGASFLSAVGDTLLVFAVPAGLGIETSDLRTAVLMWLIPACAMYTSSYLAHSMKSRKSTVRSDYARLLMALAVLEIFIASLSMFVTAKASTIFLVASFVFLYAFAKEGVPRLLYSIAVYRFFGSESEYTRIAGKVSALNILAMFVGGVLAMLLIKSGTWRYALLADALTFLAMGFVLIRFGRDPLANELLSAEVGLPVISRDQALRPHHSGLGTVAMAVPFFFAINAIAWNYLPLLTQKFDIIDAATSIFAISVLRIPGLLAGYYVVPVSQLLGADLLLKALPLIYFLFTLIFLFFPSMTTLGFFVISNGLVAGLFWPLDAGRRQCLSHDQLVGFNTGVLRALSVAQLISCFLALAIFSNQKFSLLWLVGGVVLATLVAIVAGKLTFRAHVKRLSIAVLCSLFLSGCETPWSREKNSPVNVVLPSVSRDFTLRADLTYAAMVLLNSTSARLLDVSQDLTISGNVLDKYSVSDEGTRYLIELKSNYRSARNEAISAEDLAYSIRYLLSEKPSVAGPYKEILGADRCKNVDCKISGLEVLGPFKLRLTLSHPDLRFIDRLASPWLILLKRERPTVETIGDCILPYQTGLSIVESCDDMAIRIMAPSSEKVILSDKPILGMRVRQLVSSNPGTTTTPSLTTLALFANPRTNRISKVNRIDVMNIVRGKSSFLAKNLALKHAALLTPEWMGIESPPTIAMTHARVRPVECLKVPIRILLDTSLPDLEKIRSHLLDTIPCPVQFAITNADTYFSDFASADFGMAWFTPDFLDLYNVVSPFDCESASPCYFDWQDSELKHAIKSLKDASARGLQDKAAAIRVEKILNVKGYVVPIANMNWWIRSEKGTRSVHPAGLFQVRIEDFLL